MSLIVFILRLILALFIIQFYFQLYRLGRNPLAVKIYQFTAPVLLPIRIIIAKLCAQLKIKQKIDISPLILAFLIAFFVIFIIHKTLIPSLYLAFYVMLHVWLNVLIYSIILSVIASWLQTPPQQPVLQIAIACHHFIMKPLRKIIPPFGIFDLTPIIALFLLFMIKGAL